MVYTTEHPPFAVTADVVALSARDDDVHVLLVTRGSDPYAGRLALPGGFVDPDEDLEPAARRELREETGLAHPDAKFVQLGAYGAPGRDPRMRTVSVVYLVPLDVPVDVQGGDDAAHADWYPVEPLLGEPERLAFDHGRILADAVAAYRATP